MRLLIVTSLSHIYFAAVCYHHYDDLKANETKVTHHRIVHWIYHNKGYGSENSADVMWKV